jgi:uncharacterized protein YjlB
MKKLLKADIMTKPNIQTFLIPDDGKFPNNDALPLILMRQVFDPKTKNLVQTIEKTFHTNAWERSWRNGIYDFHHYHSTAHEVLGLYAGRVKAQFGGPDGQVADAKAGDVIVIPAGVSHKNLDQSPDFRCVGAYPAGQSPDMQYGKSGERPHADQKIRSVSLPKIDPIFGKNGPLLEIWGKALERIIGDIAD